MGQGFFNFGVDPKAGEWKHEILWRLFYGLIAVFISTEPICYIIRNIGPPVGEVLVCSMAGLFFSLPEGAIRNNVRMGFFAALSCSLAAAFGLSATYYFESTNDFLKGIVIVLACLGGTLGLCAGIGSRSFLASILGFLAGQYTGFVAGQYYGWLLSHLDSNELFFLVLQVLLAFYLPIGISIGLAVWLGVKLSKRPSASRGTAEEVGP